MNEDHTVICIVITQNENRFFSTDLCRSSHIFKICAVPDDFEPSEETRVDVALAEYI